MHAETQPAASPRASRRAWRPRAILLDFYGTVVGEDDQILSRICRRVAAASPTGATRQEVGALWSRIFRQLCTESHAGSFLPQREIERQSLQQVLDRFEVNLDPVALSRELFDYWSHPPLFSESREVLRRCPAPICLVSNIDNAELSSALASLNLRFDCVVTSEDCRAYKPRPEMFRRALDLLGMGPDDVLHVGDSLNSDVRGGAALGIRVLWIDRQGRPPPPDLAPPQWVSGSLWGLLDVLAPRAEFD